VFLVQFTRPARVLEKLVLGLKVGTSEPCNPQRQIGVASLAERSEDMSPLLVRSLNCVPQVPFVGGIGIRRLTVRLETLTSRFIPGLHRREFRQSNPTRSGGGRDGVFFSSENPTRFVLHPLAANRIFNHRVRVHVYKASQIPVAVTGSLVRASGRRLCL